MHSPTATTLVLTDRPEDLARAGAMLAGGELVAFPTETVYGLGADATDPQAIAQLYAAKGRPRFNPLIAHVASLDQALALGEFPTEARVLAEAFWPGPLTLVVPARAGGPVCELARAGLDSVAIRVPDHPVAQAILQAAGRPVAAPSANRSGHVSASDARHVEEDLAGRIAAIVDGGATPIGVESTIVGCLGGVVTLLRPGGVPREAIEAKLGRPLETASADPGRPLAPGRLSSHYAPQHGVRLNATALRPGEAYLGFGSAEPGGAEPVARLNLSRSGDLAEAASRLYGCLRVLDSVPSTGIAVAPLPGTGLGEAIQDRLSRAAAPRETASSDASDTLAKS
ncbi:L-threonylcarbamoyladenylate synthase [Rhabdaerophilum sp. SD176]|uniref:L-threonylcarbamoyladenylate synthase n=1 Tax=Rhabdaerophilum sp. SD176 TaxID=2983548 RepID=UPI0024DFBC73|nr:L-threonylcarbamoyladenylate synthase [Rhabdaerophilum sp. SD176]